MTYAHTKRRKENIASFDSEIVTIVRFWRPLPRVPVHRNPPSYIIQYAADEHGCFRYECYLTHSTAMRSFARRFSNGFLSVLTSYHGNGLKVVLGNGKLVSCRRFLWSTSCVCRRRGLRRARSERRGEVSEVRRDLQVWLFSYWRPRACVPCAQSCTEIR